MKKLYEHLNEDEKKSLSGHRERLRSRYITQTEDHMEDNRLLELLLTYAIPRKDVYLLANSLLMRFGDISGVLSASVDDLMTVDGIGRNTAILINMVSTLERRKRFSEMSRKHYDSTDSVAREICKLFYGVRDERMLIMTFDDSMSLITYEFISEGSSRECDVDLRKAGIILGRTGVANVAIAHNHPSGDINPSYADVCITHKLESLVAAMKVKLVDVFIVSGDSYLRMSKATRLANALYTTNNDISYTFDGPLASEEAYELAALINQSKAEHCDIEE